MSHASLCSEIGDVPRQTFGCCDPEHGASRPLCKRTVVQTRATCLLHCSSYSHLHELGTAWQCCERTQAYAPALHIWILHPLLQDVLRYLDHKLFESHEGLWRHFMKGQLARCRSSARSVAQPLPMLCYSMLYFWLLSCSRQKTAPKSAQCLFLDSNPASVQANKDIIWNLESTKPVGSEQPRGM